MGEQKTLDDLFFNALAADQELPDVNEGQAFLRDLGTGNENFLLKLRNAVNGLNVQLGGLEVTKWTQLSGVLTPASFGTDQDDYNPTGQSNATVLRLTATSDVSITGIAGGSSGRVLVLHNVGSNVITLSREDAGSVAANRISCDSDVCLYPGAVETIQYDATSSRWRFTGKGIRPEPYGASEGTTSRTATSWLQKLNVPFTVGVDGLYEVKWYAEGRSNDSGTQIRYRVRLDDSTTLGQADPNPESNQQVGWGPLGGWWRGTITAGAHDVDLDFRSSKSGEQVQIRRVRIKIRRIC